MNGGMLTGDVVALRARRESDIPILDAELHDDVVTYGRGDSRPWRPIPPGSTASSYRITDPAADPAHFSVVELASEELAGGALLWGVDTHNRMGHVGISLRPSFRGRGLGTDTVRVLCRYGFEIRRSGTWVTWYTTRPPKTPGSTSRTAASTACWTTASPGSRPERTRWAWAGRTP
jgi:RimJ/RimL family protein N-acetyltransferase